MKLSDRALLILTLIRKRCARCELWVPPRTLSETLYIPGTPRNVRVPVSGGGDASVIKSLWKKGLCRESNVQDYACTITEQGIQACDDPENIKRLTAILTVMDRQQCQHQLVLDWETNKVSWPCPECGEQGEA